MSRRNSVAIIAVWRLLHLHLITKTCLFLTLSFKTLSHLEMFPNRFSSNVLRYFQQDRLKRIGMPAETPVISYRFLDKKNQFKRYPDETRFREICPSHGAEACVCFSRKHPRLARSHVGFHQGDPRRLAFRGPTNQTLYKPVGAGVPEVKSLKLCT